jgi:hypothetical protein
MSEMPYLIPPLLLVSWVGSGPDDSVIEAVPVAEDDAGGYLVVSVRPRKKAAPRGRSWQDPPVRVDPA